MDHVWRSRCGSVLVVVLLLVASVRSMPLPSTVQTPVKLNETDQLKEVVTGLRVLQTVLGSSGSIVYKTACKFSHQAQLLIGESSDERSLGLRLAVEQNIADICNWMNSELVNFTTYNTTSINNTADIQPVNCSRTTASSEVQQLCDRVLPYLELQDALLNVQEKLTDYTRHEEVPSATPSSWGQLESEYANTLAQQVPKEVAPVITALFSQ